MKILVINGSPKGNKSNSMKLTTAFIEGMQSKLNAEIESLNLSDFNIRPCLGCFGCWSKTPGKCVIEDDVASILEKELAADIIIWSFPLYYFGLPAPMKALLDRHLPTVLPFMAKDGNESGGHLTRYDMSGKRRVFISTCGFYTSEGNYDGLNLQFDRCYGKGNYETLYCGQGELFRVPELRERTNEYLKVVKKAGQEFAEGGILANTKRALSQLLFERAAFETMADASWGISRDEGAGRGEQGAEGTVTPTAFLWTRQMAALYNPNAYNGKERVVEMYYTDIQKRYQMVLGKEGARVLDRDFLPFTTKIETPYTVWHDIADGKISGQEAMMQHLYRVEGDFELMLKWNEIFGVTAIQEEEAGKPPIKKTNMTWMLLPWIVLWIALPISGVIGGCIGILTCAILTFAAVKWRITIFEHISTIVCTGISLLAVLGVTTSILPPLTYLLFGLMWLVTVFQRIPLTAYYSLNDYGGDSALDNGLFIRTNRILTACWAVLYVATSIWSYFLMLSEVGWISGVLNAVLPVLMGGFTAWFQRWYPPYYASK